MKPSNISVLIYCSDFLIYRTRVACLCLAATDNLVACGTFDKLVLFFDPRNGYAPITFYTAHKKSVLSLGIDDTRIISGGEDGILKLFDFRARKVVSSITVSVMQTAKAEPQ